MNKIIERTIEEPKQDDFTFQNIQLSENGKNIYLLSRKNFKNKYVYNLKNITESTTNDLELPTQNNNVKNYKVILEDNTLIMAGFNSNRNNDNFDGVHFLKADLSNLKIDKNIYSPFTSQFLFDSYGNRDKKFVPNIKIKELLVNQNGEIFLCGEEQYLAKNSKYQTFCYDDIILCKINNEGKVDWFRNINKKQYETEIDFCSFLSYSYFLKDNELNIFLNTKDKIKNIRDNRIEFRQPSINNFCLYHIKINRDGEYDYNEILDSTENEVPFMISKGVFSDNNMFFIGKKRKTKQLLKITM